MDLAMVGKSLDGIRGRRLVCPFSVGRILDAEGRSWVAAVSSRRCLSSRIYRTVFMGATQRFQGPAKVRGDRKQRKRERDLIPICESGISSAPVGRLPVARKKVGCEVAMQG